MNRAEVVVGSSYKKSTGESATIWAEETVEGMRRRFSDSMTNSVLVNPRDRVIHPYHDPDGRGRVSGIHYINYHIPRGCTGRSRCTGEGLRGSCKGGCHDCQ